MGVDLHPYCPSLTRASQWGEGRPTSPSSNEGVEAATCGGKLLAIFFLHFGFFSYALKTPQSFAFQKYLTKQIFFCWPPKKHFFKCGPYQNTSPFIPFHNQKHYSETLPNKSNYSSFLRGSVGNKRVGIPTLVMDNGYGTEEIRVNFLGKNLPKPIRWSAIIRKVRNMVFFFIGNYICTSWNIV